MVRLRDEGRERPDARMRVGAWLRYWLDTVAAPTLRRSTLDSYEDLLRVHLVPGLGDHRLATLTPADVARFLAERHATGLSARRVAYLHAVLRRALGVAERWGLVTRNVARLVDPPRVPRHEITPLTADDARRLLAATAAERHGPLWATALGTGLRQGELLGLRWADVDLDARRLRVRHTLALVDGRSVLLEPKTSRSRRTLVLADAVVVALRTQRERQAAERIAAGERWIATDHVFTSRRGTPYHGATVLRAFQATLERIGLPRMRFHDLRHSTATLLLGDGFGLQDIKELLGHSTIVLTSDTYGHVVEGRQADVARGMDRLLAG